MQTPTPEKINRFTILGASGPVIIGGVATVIAVIIMSYAIPQLRTYQNQEHLSK